MQNIYIEADAACYEKVSGIGHTVIEMLKQFSVTADTSKFKVTAIVPYGKSNYIEDLHLDNIHIRQLPPPYKYINFLLVRTKLFIPIDLLFGRGVYIFPNYKNWSLLFSKSITFFHDMSFKLFPETVEPKNKKYLDKNAPTWIKRADKIVAISDNTHRDLVEFYPQYENKIITIMLGVNHQAYKKRSVNSVEVIKAKYSLPEKYIIYVGNIEPRKNVELLVDAYGEMFRQKHIDEHLLIVGGGGWLNEAVVAKVQKLRAEGVPIDSPSGYVSDDDLVGVISGASLLVHPALYEGFGLPVLQAMATETPVLSSDSSSLSEIGGDTIEYFSVNSKEDLVKKLDQIICGKVDRQQMTSSAFARSKQFTWEKTVTSLLFQASRMYNGKSDK